MEVVLLDEEGNFSSCLMTRKNFFVDRDSEQSILYLNYKLPFPTVRKETSGKELPGKLASVGSLIWKSGYLDLANKRRSRITANQKAGIIANQRQEQNPSEG